MSFFEQYHRIGKDGKKYWGRMGAGIVFTDGKTVLLLQRSDKSDHPGYWCIPGGKAEQNESPIDCAVRESKEECGKAEGLRFAQFHTKDGAHHFHTFLYSVDKPFDVKLSDEHSDYKWTPINEVHDLKLLPKFKESWDAYLRAIRRRFESKKSFYEWMQQKESL